MASGYPSRAVDTVISIIELVLYIAAILALSILYGDQLRQARLDDWIFQGILDVEHLPR